MDTSFFDQAASSWDEEPRRVALMRAIGEKVLQEARPSKDVDVLDYGCGTGLVGLFLLPHVRSVTGADNSCGMLEVLRGKIAAEKLETMKAVQLNLEQDPVPAERYQMVVVSMALHHIAQVGRVLRAFHELLVPGGTLCLADLDTEPGTFHPAEIASTVYHHGFGRAELKNQLIQIGFSDPRDTTVAAFRKPVENGDEEEFSIFLIAARR